MCSARLLQAAERWSSNFVDLVPSVTHFYNLCYTSLRGAATAFSLTRTHKAGLVLLWRAPCVFMTSGWAAAAVQPGSTARTLGSRPGKNNNGVSGSPGETPEACRPPLLSRTKRRLLWATVKTLVGRAGRKSQRQKVPSSSKICFEILLANQELCGDSREKMRKQSYRISFFFSRSR